MQYFSTNRRSPHVSFRQALINGQPPDMGLYFPTAIPLLHSDFWANFKARSKAQIAFDVIRPYVEGEFADESLFNICAETVDFDFPLISITENISVLELFHGPTFAFKDVGARFMSRCLQHFSTTQQKKTLVVVATSGDTGGAVASGFFGADGVEVVILYPSGKVSRLQELQLTTHGGNVTAIEVEGTFDDCQALAKQSLADKDLKGKTLLTSANSINIARWLPQQFYYFFALQQWESDIPPVISVPSGNFGNICAGILAHVSGLPVATFVAACNANDVVTRFLKTKEFDARPSVATLSNAMDVGNPSNFVRILEIFDKDHLKLKDKMTSFSVSDAETTQTMREIYEKFGYVLDPHGAVGVFALKKYLEDRLGEKGFFLETAHPVKFDSVMKITGTFGNVPSGVEDLLSKQKQSIKIPVNYLDLKEVLLARLR